MQPVHLSEIKPRELKEIALEKSLILIPIGTTEWHTDHLSLGVDSLLSQAICDDISAQTGCAVAPLLSYGVARNLKPEKGYFGTVDTINLETLAALLVDLGQGYAKMGFRKAVLFTGHGEADHWEAISSAISRSKQIEIVMLSAYDFTKDEIQELDDIEKTWLFAGDQAAERETPMMLHYYPRLVDMSSAPDTIELNMPGIPGYIHRRFPRRASQSVGQKIAGAVISGGVMMINQLLDSMGNAP